MAGLFLLSISVFVFSFFIPLLFLFIGSVRHIKLDMRQILAARKIVSFHMVMLYLHNDILWPPCKADADIIFSSCFYLSIFLSFFLA